MHWRFVNKFELFSLSLSLLFGIYAVCQITLREMFELRERSDLRSAAPGFPPSASCTRSRNVSCDPPGRSSEPLGPAGGRKNTTFTQNNVEMTEEDCDPNSNDVDTPVARLYLKMSGLCSLIFLLRTCSTDSRPQSLTGVFRCTDDSTSQAEALHQVL